MRQLILASAAIARRQRATATFILYGSVAAIGYGCAYVLQFGLHVPVPYQHVFLPTLLLLVLLRLSAFAVLHLHRSTWRYAGARDVARLGAAIVAGSLAFLLASESRLFGIAVPRVIVLLEAGITANIMAGVWLSYRAACDAECAHSGMVLQQRRALIIEDLLGRVPVRLALPELAVELERVSVLITGAAGSIGSELSRQVALHGPRTLILFDHDETQLYYLELELREHFPDVLLVPVIGDITDSAALEGVFQCYAPDWVFHAAAYKHVPMMESNAREAIRNNLIATHRLAATAGRHYAQKFVLMSTDKAVRPCSVMGASKRLAELAVLELQARFPDTAFTAVRFGNVLGSSGSVLPIFERQLSAGRPLTVTHPEATRYFMTVPEAVQLILQASMLADSAGRVVMLEMGTPIRIIDIAQNFLRLAGRVHGSGIVFTGLRAGERLHEELIAPDETTLATTIPKVRLVITPRAIEGEMERLVKRWGDQIDGGQEAAVWHELRHRFPELCMPARLSQHVTPSAHSGSVRHAVAEAAHFVSGPGTP